MKKKWKSTKALFKVFWHSKTFLIMRIAMFLILFSVIQVMAKSSYSQSTRLSLNLKDVSIEHVLDEIENQSEFYFLYNQKLVNVNRKVDVNTRNKKISDILANVFEGEDVNYLVMDRQIVVSPKYIAEKVDVKRDRKTQELVITGTVTDEDGNPLPGVTIQVKGSIMGTIADSDGNYTITVPEGSIALVFSFIGMKTQEVIIGNQSTINIIFEYDTIGLEEVIAVGYGTQRRSNLTGSVSDIKGDKLTKRNSMQTMDALQGIAPGVNVSPSSGQPGSQSTIRIRGEGTLTIGASASKNNPLVLIDGVEGNINDVEPSNVESISFLKDAASGAIYGSRASNGVILIETKRGEKGKLFVSYDVNMGFQVPTDMVKFTGAYEYMNGYNEALENEGKMPIFDDEYIQNWQANHPSGEYPSVDWLDVVLEDNAFQQKHTLTVNSGSDKVTNLATITYLDQKSVMPNTSFSRYGIRSNTDIQATDRLHFRFDIKGSTSDNLQPSQTQLWYQLYRAKPNQQAILPDGRYGVGYQNINPLAMANDGGVSEGNSKIGTINAKADYKLSDNFSIEFTFAPTYTLYESNSFVKMYDTYTWEGNYAGSYPTKNELNVRHSNTQNIYGNALARYKKSIGLHNVNIIAGYDQTAFSSKWTNAYRDNFALQDYQVLNAGDPANQTNSGSGYEWSLRSVFGRVNYNFNEKYLFEANFRYDGSSRFVGENKYAFFPSFSAGWRISEEDFLNRIGFISNLKLRGSWGKLGNQQIGTYPFLTTVNLGTSYDMAFGEQTHNGAAITSYSNRDIKWETTTISNIGLDLGLFKNKFSLYFDYYLKRTEDILLRLPIPSTMGYAAPFQNAGTVDNKGWDLVINYNNRTGDFNYGASFILSDVRNEVIDLKGTGPYNYSATTIREGEPIHAILGFEADGLFQTQSEVDEYAQQFGTVEPGDIKFKDQNGDGVINADDRVVIGNQIPRLTYGLDLTAGYKGFDVRVFIQGVGDKDSYLDNELMFAFNNGGQLQQWMHDDHWTPDNPNAKHPRYWIANPNNKKVSTYWMRSAAYMRLKNVQLGYTLPKELLNRLHISNLRVYVAGDNLFTLDNFYPNVDPETIFHDSGRHIYMISYTLGINVQF